MTNPEHSSESSKEQSEKFDEQYQFGVATAHLANEARNNAIEREEDPDDDKIFGELASAASNLIGRDSDLEKQRREFELKERSGPYVDMVENAFATLNDMGITNQVKIGNKISTGLGGVIDLSDENGDIQRYNVQLRHVTANPSSREHSQESYSLKLAPLDTDENPSTPTLSMETISSERIADMTNPAEGNRELTKSEIPSEEKIKAILDLLTKNKIDELNAQRAQNAETQNDSGELQKSMEQFRIVLKEHEAACLKSAREYTSLTSRHNLPLGQESQAQLGVEELRLTGSTLVMAGAQTGSVKFNTTMYYGVDPQTHEAKLNDEDLLTQADMIAENQKVISTVAMVTRGMGLSKSLDKLFDLNAEKNDMDISVMYVPAEERVTLMSFNAKTRQTGIGYELTNDDQDESPQQRDILAKVLSSITKQYESGALINYQRTTL